jgi:hypothetical protein
MLETLELLLTKAYTQMTADHPDFFEYYRSVTTALEPYLVSEAVCKTFPTLQALFKAKDIPVEYAYIVRDLFEEYVARQIRLIALVQFLHMRNTKDWGDLGEQRISISYCRHLLNIPNDREVTQFDADRFEQQIKGLGKPYLRHTPEQLRAIDEETKCNLIIKIIDYSREKDIHWFLEFIESEKGLIAGQLGIYRSVIYGTGKIIRRDEYRITTFTQELARTPAAVLSIAAVVGGKHIAIRLASCETIFANKWVQAMKLTTHDIYFALLNDYEHIGLIFKLRALLAYRIRSLTDVRNSKAQFIEEMEEGLLWHELGHGIVINNLLTPEDSAFGEALGVLGANIISVMKEILADWAPRHGTLKGPMHLFSEIARTDVAKATRMIYVYLSDNWFLGDSEDSFGNHTDIMTALIFKHIHPDGRINFESLNKELEPTGHDIFSHTLQEYNRITKYLEEQIKNSTFVYDGQPHNFADIEKVYTEKARGIDKETEETAIEFLVLRWAKLIEDLPQLNKQLLHTMQAYLAEENKKYHEYLMRTYFKQHVTTQDGTSLREFALALIKEKGFWFNAPEIPHGELTEGYEQSLENLLQYFDQQARIAL